MRRPSGTDEYWERFRRHAGKTFEEAAQRYLTEFDGRDKRRQAYALEALLPYIGKLRLIDVDDEAMSSFKDDRLNGKGRFERKSMVGTVNKELTLVTTILNKACRIWRWIPSAPLIQQTKGARRTAYPLTWEEQDRLFACLPTGWDVGAALFAVNTGVRKEELFGLKWSDMVALPSIGDDVFVFVLQETKNGEQRAVICNSIARRAVAYQRKNGSAYVFPSRAPGRNGEKVRNAGKVWIRAWQAAKLPDGPYIKKGIHNLRHTFAHRLRAVGVAQEDRNALLGHARTNLAEHYAMPDIERLLAAAEKVTERKDTVVLRAVQSAA